MEHQPQNAQSSHPGAKAKRRQRANNPKHSSNTGPPHVPKHSSAPSQSPAARQPARSISESSTSSNSDNVCPICHETETIHAVPMCNHHICFKCSTRMRYLLQQFYCPICRADCSKVYFVHRVRPYDSIESGGFSLERKAKVWLEDPAIRTAYQELVAHRCRLCPDAAGFNSFKELQNHVKRVHQLFFCDICSENVKLFTSERKAYDRHDLATHKRKGDEDDRSFKGHPLCQICDNRYLDTDELWRHLRKDHFFCHFCDADGEHIYFGTYDDVKDHFRSDHFLCEEDECARIQFTTAFRTELDLKAHKAQYHLKGSRRSQRQARAIEVNFSYGEPPRRNQREPRTKPNQNRDGDGNQRSDAGGTRSNSRFTQEDMDTAKAIAASLTTSHSDPALNQLIDVSSTNDFPSLLGDSRAPSAAVSKPFRNVSSHQDLQSVEEYPSLSRPATAAAPAAPTVRPNSGKPVKKPLAAAAAPSAAPQTKVKPWSKAEDEFPALDSGASRPSPVHGWHFKRPEPQPAPVFINNRRPAINSNADFPTLGGGGASTSLASLATWINAGKSGSGKKPAPTPEQAFVKASQSEQTSKSADPKAPTSPKAPSSPATKKKKKKKPASNEAVAVQANGESDKTAATNGAPPGGATENPERKADRQPTGSESQGKSLGKTPANHKPSKKLASLQVDLEEDFPSLSTVKSSQSSARSDVVTAPKPSTNQKPGSQGGSAELNPNDYPSLSATTKRPPPGLLSGKTYPGPSSAQSKPSAPPGLSVSRPPGLSVADPAAPSPFNMDAIANLLGTGDTGPAKAHAYAEPRDFRARNKKLSYKLKELIYHDQEKLQQFKSRTNDYQSGVVSGHQFHRGCESLLTPWVWYQILPELIALLPDISRQQELHQLCAEDIRRHTDSNQLWSSAAEASLVCCPTCQQVLVLSDQTHHQLTHEPATDCLSTEPSVGNGSAVPNAWNGYPF